MPELTSYDADRMFCGTSENSLWVETASAAGWTLRLYNSYKKQQQEHATSIILILEPFFVLFPVRILFGWEFFFLSSCLQAGSEAKVHLIFLSDRIVFPFASVVMASHPRNTFDVIYVGGSE